MHSPVIRAAMRGVALAAILAGTTLFAATVPAAADTDAASAEPAPASPTLVQARSLAATGDSAGAIRVLQPYVVATPGDVAAARYLGDLRLMTGDLPGAERAYLAVLGMVPNDRETHGRLGNLYARQDRLDEAIAQFERVLPDTSAFADLVRTHKRRGDLAAFVETYRHAATDAFPPSPFAQFQYGVILVDLYKPQEALPYLQSAAAANDSCPTETALGNALVDLDRASEGSATIRRCLAREPDNYDALVGLGVALTSSDPAAAGASLDRAETLRPGRSEAIVDLGYLSDAAGKRDAAMPLFERAIAVDPFSRAAYVDLGYDQLEDGSFLAAETTFLRGLSVSNDDGRIEYLLAETFERQGKNDLARSEYRHATHSEEPEVAAAAAVRLGRVQ